MSRRRLLLQGVPGGGQAPAQEELLPSHAQEVRGEGPGDRGGPGLQNGRLIFTDKPAFIVKEEGFLEMFLSVMIQLDNLSEEEDSTFYAMTEPWPTRDRGSELDKAWLDFSESYRNIEMTILIQNGVVKKRWSHVSLYLSSTLINHSCSPNAAVAVLERFAMVGEKSDHVLEIRAIQAIKKGEEITTFYSFASHAHFRPTNIAMFGCTAQERMITIKRERGFDCKCGVCSGDVEDQGDVMRQLSELYKTLDTRHDQKKASDYSASDWTREVKIWIEIVDKTRTLHIGGIYAKFSSVSLLAVTAQLARDKKLLEKAMDKLKKLVEDANFEYMRFGYVALEEGFRRFSNKLKAKKPPKKEELDLFKKFFEIEGFGW